MEIRRIRVALLALCLGAGTAHQMKGQAIPERRGVAPPAALTLAEARARADGAINLNTMVFPSPAQPFYLGDIACEAGTCRCGHNWDSVMRLVPVPPAAVGLTSARLGLLADVGMFHPYSFTPYSLVGENVPQTRYRFVRRVEIDPKVREQMARFYPDEFTSQAPLESVQAIWIESAIRTDESGVPLEAAFAGVVPLAVQTASALYLVFVDYAPDPRHISCMEAVHYEGLVLQVVNPTDSLSSVAGQYLAELKNQFAQAPIAASEVRDATTPAGEVWLRRPYLRSMILGRPYFELSTYMIKWWSVGSGRESGAVARQFDAGDDKFYVQVTQTLFRAVGVNGKYAEPTNPQGAKFQTVVTAAINQVRQTVCARFQGTLQTLADGPDAGVTYCEIRSQP
jgi:hypothetical protein